MTDTLTLEGSTHFRQRLICSTLLQKTIIIENIRGDQQDLGLKDYEAGFLRLLEKISDGCAVEINRSGTRVRFRPGVIVGGEIFHDCGTSRAMGYFLEGLICLAPFGKQSLKATLKGIANDNHDLSVDLFRTVSLPLLQRFGIEDGIEFKIQSRGARPDGGGSLYFECPTVKQLKPIQLLDPGQITRIRGIAYTSKISPTVSKRLVDSAKSLLSSFGTDAYIYTDHYSKTSEAGLSPGYAIALVAESSTGCILSAELAGEAGDIPEDVGRKCAECLLMEIAKNGCVDTSHQALTLLFMLLGPEDVSTIRLGKLSQHSIGLLRLLRDFFNVTFKLQTDEETSSVMCTVLGIGFKNLAKRMY